LRLFRAQVVHSDNLDTPVTPEEKKQIAAGAIVTRNLPEGVMLIIPRVVVAPYGLVTGVGITFGPDNEDAFFHRGTQ
jgi:hypothetical protein